MGQTFAEKIFSKKTNKKVIPGEIVMVSPDYILTHDNTSAIAKTFAKIGVDKVKDPDKCVIILDHVIPPATEKYAQNHKEVREFVAKQGIKNFYDINTGICHQVLPEKGFARPGLFILGSDSHTTAYGALGAFSTGIGRSEAAAVWATGELWLMVPESYKIVIDGKFPDRVSAKDITLKIIGDIGADGALYKSVEFTGSAISNMPVSQRLVLTNMTVEMGGKNGYIAPDEKTASWLKDYTDESYEVIFPDDDAIYEKTLHYNVNNLEPQIAKPHTVDNVCPVKDVEGTKIHQALLGTCTNGRLDDLHEAAKILEGKTIDKNVRLLVFPASTDIYKKAMKDGTLSILADSGAIIMNSGCGPCLGAHEGVLAPGEVCISTANRNFKGRMGCNEADVYLSSPATVAASAIKGCITDPRNV